VNSAGIKGQWHRKIFLILLIGFVPLEFYGKVVERGIGHYLKWQNHKQPQMGRVWERDKEAIAAQTQIQTIRSGIDFQEQSADSIRTLKQLFEMVEPAFPLVVSRKKFLHLYYDFPGQWSERIVSPLDLVQIDSGKSWDRVMLKRFGPWITLGFLDMEGNPIREEYLSIDALFEVQSTRTLKRGTLEDAGFDAIRIYPINQFLPILKNLDLETQKAVFPQPRWFLGKDYHITRVGVEDVANLSSFQQHSTFGIEYDTDYYTGVLLIPVPVEITYNILSLIDRSDGDASMGDLFSLGESETP
jgi:hypothetical protein